MASRSEVLTGSGRSEPARSGRYEPVVLGILGLILFCGIWELAADLNWINPIIASSPSRVARAFVQAWSSGELPSDLIVSLRELAVGFLLSSVGGIAIGVVMGLSLNAEFVLDPFMWFWYSAPIIAFYPLFIVWIGFGFWTVVAITFTLTVIPVTVNTLAGVRSADQTLVRAVRSFGGSNLDVVFKVMLPSAIPLILTGLRIGLGRALIGVIVGELFSSNFGLGYRISFYGAKLQTTNVFVSLVAIVILGVGLTQLLKLLEDRLFANQAAAAADVGGEN
ncbi:MAG: ABC transporter permease [Chloroflexota bacterium]|nr:ABC transporter permease [Chloroflexota bacterium]